MTLIQENPEYSFLQLIAALGSNMNAFTGLTFLVIHEFADALVCWISYILKQVDESRRGTSAF